MYDHILISTGRSNPAEMILEYALQIASEHEATLHVLDVADTSRDSVTRIRKEIINVLEQEGQRIVEDAAQPAEDEAFPSSLKASRATRTRRLSTTASSLPSTASSCRRTGDVGSNGFSWGVSLNASSTPKLSP